MQHNGNQKIVDEIVNAMEIAEAGQLIFFSEDFNELDNDKRWEKLVKICNKFGKQRSDINLLIEDGVDFSEEELDYLLYSSGVFDSLQKLNVALQDDSDERLKQAASIYKALVINKPTSLTHLNFRLDQFCIADPLFINHLTNPNLERDELKESVNSLPKNVYLRTVSEEELNQLVNIIRKNTTMKYLVIVGDFDGSDEWNNIPIEQIILKSLIENTTLEFIFFDFIHSIDNELALFQKRNKLIQDFPLLENLTVNLFSKRYPALKVKERNLSSYE